ncbi:serine hydrolase domain-containing protein [Ulvibacterium sp.]|uniref:serine hydrolase domain-containing protein n=1 Tax=Ulvibacterium sp. TaxID=2665914 RepID=UPI003BA95666
MKAKSKILGISMTLQCMLLGSGLFSQIDTKVKTKLDSYLSIQKERIGFNGVVLIADKDDVLYQKAIGQASFELQIPLEMDAKFKIASISKSFTGMLLVLAEEEGKIRLEDTLGTYFPDLKMAPEWQRVTLGELASHTSGVPHWKGYKDYWPIRSRIPLDTEQVLADVFTMELVDDHGLSAHYSSPAYFLLAVILERTYKRPYGQLFKEKIADPLEMQGSGEYDGIGIVLGMVSGYHLLPNDSLVLAPYRDMSTMRGGGHLYSTAHDLLKWNRSLLGNGFWKESLLERYLAPLTDATFPSNNDAKYAMGQYVHFKSPSRPMAYQAAGGTFGFSSISAVYPEQGMTIVILGNASFLPMNEIWADMEKIVFKRPFKLPEIFKGSQLSKRELSAYSGTYRAENGMVVRMDIFQGDLYAKLGNNPPFRILHETDNVFYGTKANVRFEFVERVEGIGISGVIATGKGRTQHFKRQ